MQKPTEKPLKVVELLTLPSVVNNGILKKGNQTRQNNTTILLQILYTLRHFSNNALWCLACGYK